MARTKEGAFAKEHSMNHALEFFSKAGSLFVKRDSYYGRESSALDLFKNSWYADKILSMKLLLWLRDCRGGAGNRSGSREIFTWLAKNDPQWLGVNLSQIPQVGRWDDLRCLFNTPLERYAAMLWASEIRNENVLAAKWADRKDAPLRKQMDLTIADFRRLLARIRKSHIVEHSMCQKKWEDINYKSVPSVAMARYTNAFMKNDFERFNEYKTKLVTGEEKVHADVLFPHDCVRTSRYGDTQIADAQFDALPDYLTDANGNKELIITICDTSGSMSIHVAGKIMAVDVSQGMALYCSSRMPKGSPFYKRFIAFCSESEFKDWRGKTFSEAVKDRYLFNGAIGSTRIDTALKLILKTARERNIPQEFMPTTLLIVSDMQFHHADADGGDTEVDKCLNLFKADGYIPPKIVYWNTAGYAGSQGTVSSKNVGLVSGFSPSILKAVFNGDDFSPMAIMMRTLEKYEVVSPE